MASTTNQDELRSADIFKLQTTAGLLAKYADRIFNAEISISQSQFAVLLIIESATSPVNQSDVAGRLQRGLNSVSMMVDRLVKLGFVERTRSDSDRRENYLALTSNGRDKVAKGKRVNKLLARRLTSTFTEKEAQEVMRLLTKLEEQIIKEIGHGVLSM
jgi:DNA-binding MarR family transcriptional regulator